MKNYNLSDYKTFGEFERQLLATMNEEFVDLECGSTKYANCEITEVSNFSKLNDRYEPTIELSTLTGFQYVKFLLAVENKIISIPADKEEALRYYVETYNNFYTEFHNKIVAEVKISSEKIYQDYLKQRKAEIEFEKHRAEYEAQEKLEKRIKKSKKEFELKLNTKIPANSDEIEWLRNNTVSISAVIPEHLEKVFVSNFGDQPHTIVPTNKKTSNGYVMKFSASFSLLVKKNAEIHPKLEKLFKKNRLNNTSYISMLVKYYDFNFGKQSSNDLQN